MEIITLPIDSLTPYKLNARRHTEYQVEKICESIKEYGFNDPVGIWGEKNLIVEGHGRLLAAKQLGLTEVPCIRLDHLTEAQRKEYAVMHNHSNDLSGWDWNKLIRDLDEFQFDKLGLEIPVFDRMGASQGDRLIEKVDVPIYFPVTVMENEDDHSKFTELKEALGIKKDVDLVRYLVHQTRKEYELVGEDEEGYELDEEGEMTTDGEEVADESNEFEETGDNESC